MLKNRNTISSTKIYKRSIRPSSSGTNNSKKVRNSLQINHIISSLQKNVKDLKVHYHNRQEMKHNTISTQKSKGFRVNKVLHRNRSQSNLKRTGADKNDDKSLADVFEIKSYFMKVHGRQSNNIVELYQFYKKNIQKRQKSTRILASIDMSNPNMGLSLQVGKQSLLKQQFLQPHKQNSKRDYKQSPKVQEKLQFSNKFDVSSKLENTSGFNKGPKKAERPSHLASQLISKGLFNIANVANLMMNKKYKLTKDKQESFRVGKLQRQKVNSLKVQVSKQNNSNLINAKMQKSQDCMIQQLKQMKQNMLHRNLITLQSIQNSTKKQFDQQISFKNNKKKTVEDILQKQGSMKSIDKLSSQKCQKPSEKKSFEISSIKKQGNQIIKLQQISGLQESPIVANKNKDFTKSKYYVQPIPASKHDFLQQKSISLKQNSRIIDLDMLPFDL